jgi:hypothetical protein
MNAAFLHTAIKNGYLVFIVNRSHPITINTDTITF